MWIKELRGVIVVEINTKPVLVNVSMMPPAHRQQVWQRCLAVFDPMLNVVRVADSIGAPGETAALIAGGQRSANCGGNGATLAAYIDDAAGIVFQRWDDAAIT